MIDTKSQFHSLILAAGLSRRMGAANKLLLDYNDLPLLAWPVKAALDCSAQTAVVLGHEGGTVKERLRESLSASAQKSLWFTANPAYENGHQSSVLWGLQKLAPLLNPSDAVMIILGDQYRLTVAALSNLQQAFIDAGGEKVIIPRVNCQRGHPVILPAGFVRDIIDDSFVTSLRDKINTLPEQAIHWVDSAHTSTVTDMDTPQQAAQAGITAL